MSRRIIIALLFCCLFSQTTSVGRGQDYLDLPEENETTLTDRFKSFTNKFRRSSPQARQPVTQQPAKRSNPRPPRYRSKPRNSAQAQRNAATNPAARPAATAKVPSRPRTKATAQAQPRVKSSSRTSRALAPLPQLTKVKSSRSSKNSSPKTSISQRTVTAKSKPLAKRSGPQRVARKSPASSRSSELDAALADLLRQQPSGQSNPVAFSLNNSSLNNSASSRASQANKASFKSASSSKNNAFDLRRALLDDEEDSLAAEVAKAVEDAVQVTDKQPTQAETVKKELVEKTEVEKTKAVAQQTPPLPTTVDSPAITLPATIQPSVKKPAAIEPVIATPVVSKPVVTLPAKIEPAVPAPTRKSPVFGFAKPQESISIAAPPRQEIVPFKISSPAKVANDPFESALQDKVSRQAFGAAPVSPAANPMRKAQPSQPVNEQPVNSFTQPKRGILQTSQQPVIVSRVEGPRSILVGREATYQVTLENTSATNAKDLQAKISVPEWAELVDAMSTSGVVERSNHDGQAATLAWNLRELPPKASQSLRLRLIPHSGRPLQLGVRWSQAPVLTQAMVEVQEPKLELAISGPQEVRYGKAQRYRLTLRNPGTGLTEQVVLRLIPPGGDAHAAVTQKIGNLKPGAVRDIDLELTAREAGELLIQANAIADGGLKAETVKTVLCRKPDLKVDWRGPEKKYAGTVAAYYFRVRNPGTAPTEPVDLSVKLPVGAEFVSASDGFTVNKSTGIVSWRLAGIDVSEEQFMQVRCKIARPGINDFQLIAKTTDGELKDTKDFHTEVTALADLKLEVTDPQGPLPLGESVAYEIRVLNRGTTLAENINIVGLFSEGIDPTTVEGTQFEIRDGRVSFHPIKSLPAGREIVLRIHAKAKQVGTHIFRTEVTCPDLDIKLAVEETTKFYEDENRWEDGQTPYSAERQQEASRR